MSSGSSNGDRRSSRGKTPPSGSSEAPSDADGWLREAVRMLNAAERSARAAQLALRSTSALLRPAENLVCASAIHLGSAANCLRAASKYLCAIAMWPDSPVPGLFFALRVAAKRVCAGANILQKSTQMSALCKAMRATAISLALAAASFEEAALQATVMNSHHHGRDRSRSRSPSHGSPRDNVPPSGPSHSGTSGTSNAESSRDGSSRDGSSRGGASRNATPRLKISHILIKHQKSRRPVDPNDKPVTRTKDEAMSMMIEIHDKIARDLITFADAAFAFSECASARRQGDIQKHFQVGRVKKTFEDAAFALAPGQMSSVIESKSGYHILQRRE